MVLRRGLRLGAACLASGAVVIPLAADAQEDRPSFSVRDLPRPGYEPVVHTIGGATLQMEVEPLVTYDSNVYATSSDEIDDVVIEARPKISLNRAGARTTIGGEAYVHVREYLQQDQESTITFGGAMSGRMLVGARGSVRASLKFDRGVESRTDPESRTPIFVKPSKSNIYSGSLAFDSGGSRVSLRASGGAERVDFLSSRDDDRDLVAIRGSVGVAVHRLSSFDLFVDLYAIRREFDTPADNSGVNRDALTYGGQVGVSRELTGRLRGRIGVGAFRFDPADNSLRGYTGLGFGGALYWSPRPRTVVSLDLFRGDVATVRSGASGRTDTRIAIGIEQEVRHNLILTASVGWVRNQYRGAAGQEPGATSQTRETVSGQVELERLLNRRFSLFVGVSAATRNADQPLNEFTRYRATAGLRMRL